MRAIRASSRRFRRLSLPRGAPVWALALGLCLPAQGQRTATAVATMAHGHVMAVTVTDGGAGYAATPRVIITGGGGYGAAAVALLTGDAVTQIIMLTAGSGYTNAPDVIVRSPVTTAELGLRMVPQLSIQGEIGTMYKVQRADTVGDTSVWVTLTNLVLTRNPVVFVDMTSEPGFRGFYRALVQEEAHADVAPGFVWIPPGTFVIGSPESEQDRGFNEVLLTTVTLTKGFFLGRCEVTQGEYQALIGANPSYHSGGTNLPVENVSWDDATNYCAKFTEQERAMGRLPAGWEYRLPTEAQWEYACRAGTTTRFSFGDDFEYTELGRYAWYKYSSSNSTHPVGQRLPNPWGLYDMHGSVWEWCYDWHGGYPGGSVTDPQGPWWGVYRVRRGGSWERDAWFCRSACRYRGIQSSIHINTGFRMALVQVP